MNHKPEAMPTFLWVRALDRLHQVARRYGGDRQEQYAHLNSGQQRMTIGKLLRRVVPQIEYEGGRCREARTRDRSVRRMYEASVRSLRMLHSQILDELRERQVVRTYGDTRDVTADITRADSEV